MQKKHVIVIGGGAAGISAAFNLIDAGNRVTLIEKRPYLGGRIYSVTDQKTGEMIDNGQHVLAGAYAHFLKILHRLGTDVHLFKQKSLKVVFRDIYGRRDILDTSRLPGKAGMLAGLINLSGLSRTSRINAVKFLFNVQFDRIKKYNGLSAFNLLKREKQNDEIIHRFWDPLIRATINLPPKQAAANLLIVVLKKAFFAGANASRLLIPASPLSSLLAPLENWMEQQGSKVLLHTGAREIIYEDGEVQGVITSKGSRLNSQAVVSAVTAKSLRNILPEELARNKFFKPLDSYRYSAIISGYYWFDRKITDDDFVALLGTHVQWLFNRRNLVETDPEIVKKYPGHITLTISGANELADHSVASMEDLFISELKEVFPEARNAALLHKRVLVDKLATFMATPETEPLRLPTITPFRNLFLAGDWTATGLPATIEGAAASGTYAAEAIENHRDLISPA